MRGSERAALVQCLPSKASPEAPCACRPFQPFSWHQTLPRVPLAHLSLARARTHPHTHAPGKIMRQGEYANIKPQPLPCVGSVWDIINENNDTSLVASAILTSASNLDSVLDSAGINVTFFAPQNLYYELSAGYNDAAASGGGGRKQELADAAGELSFLYTARGGVGAAAACLALSCAVICSFIRSPGPIISHVSLHPSRSSSCTPTPPPPIPPALPPPHPCPELDTFAQLGNQSFISPSQLLSNLLYLIVPGDVDLEPSTLDTSPTLLDYFATAAPDGGDRAVGSGGYNLEFLDSGRGNVRGVWVLHSRRGRGAYSRGFGGGSAPPPSRDFPHSACGCRCVRG